MPLLTGGRAIVESIRRAGVTHAFCVPGESYLGVLDAFYDAKDVQLIATRHEEGAGFMAEAYAKATGRPGVCLATRGPGATHLSIALHAARHDSTPLVAFIGQVSSDEFHKDVFQEVDLVDFFTPLVKWAVEVREVDRIADLAEEAFRVATAGRPGPVVVSLPEDLLRQQAEFRFRDMPALPAPRPGAAELARAAELLTTARSVAIIAGWGVLRTRSTPLLVELAEALGAGVCAAWRRYDVFPNNHPQFLGSAHFGMPADYFPIMHEADVVLAIGTRLSDTTTQGFTIPGPHQKLIHIDIATEVIGKVAPTALGIVADAGAALADLVAAVKGKVAPGLLAERQAYVAAQREKFIARCTSKAYASSPVDPEGVVHDLGRLLPPGTAIVQDSGNHTGWFTRYYRFSGPGTFYGPTAGTMGYGVPAAVGVKIARPETPVLCEVGDGGFAMTMSEIQTACRLGLKQLVFLVFNNSLYGTIRAHQEKHYPGRPIATDLGEANFAKVAEGLGAHAERVTANADLPAALERAMNAGRPALIELITRPERLSVWAAQ